VRAVWKYKAVLPVYETSVCETGSVVSWDWGSEKGFNQARDTLRQATLSSEGCDAPCPRHSCVQASVGLNTSDRPLMQYLPSMQGGGDMRENNMSAGVKEKPTKINSTTMSCAVVPLHTCLKLYGPGHIPTCQCGQALESGCIGQNTFPHPSMAWSTLKLHDTIPHYHAGVG